jgi:hypothetical protein
MPGPLSPVPRLNLLGRDALLGLTYRALAGQADPAQAQLSLRRIERNAEEYTVAAQRRSILHSSLEIAAQKAKEGRRDQTRMELDLQLYNDRYPPPPPRGRLQLLAPRRTKEQQAQDAERAQLEHQLGLVRQDAEALQAKAEDLSKQARAVEQSYASLTAEREQLNVKFRSEVAAGVLNLVALGQADQARDVLAGGRQMLRGDLILAALWVLVALFADGPPAVPAALDETRLVWEQHPDPVRRVLEALVAVQGGAALNRQALGIFPRGNFSHGSLWRLYLLVGMLAGWPAEQGAPDTGGLGPTLHAGLLYQAQGADTAWPGSDSPAQAALWAGKQDVVCRTLVANLLLRCGRADLIPQAAGFDGLVDVPPLHFLANPQTKRRGQPWPELLARFKPRPLEAWPLPLGAAWPQALACHVLLAAKDHAPVELFEQWWDESRGWPSNPLQWWTQAALAEDAGLLNNVRPDPGGLFVLHEA